MKTVKVGEVIEFMGNLYIVAGYICEDYVVSVIELKPFVGDPQNVADINISLTA